MRALERIQEWVDELTHGFTCTVTGSREFAQIVVHNLFLDVEDLEGWYSASIDPTNVDGEWRIVFKLRGKK